MNVGKTFQTKKNKQFIALKDINLTIKQGEIFGIIGKSGAGKCTLLRCANLLERPSHGKVIVNGIDFTSLNAQDLRHQRKKIGMIFQHFNLLSQATVFKNISLAMEGGSYTQKQIQARVRTLLEVTELTDKINSYPCELSGGQKQRVAIARALANRPSVLLCDEATSALDTETTKSILTLLKRINLKFGVTILLITHQIEVVKYICHRIALMDKGSIVELAQKEEFFKSPQSPEGQSLIYTHSYAQEGLN